MSWLCCQAVVKNASLTAVEDIKTEEQQIYNTTRETVVQFLCV